MIGLPGKEKKENKAECPQFPPGMQVDEVEIEIEGVTVCLRRKVNLDVPHEVSAVIPRAEIRKRVFEKGEILCEKEVLLNSITIVHTPKYHSAGEKPRWENNTAGPRINWHYSAAKTKNLQRAE